MRHFIIESGDYVTTTGLYRMLSEDGLHDREYTLIRGDACPTFAGKKTRFRLIRAAPHPKKG